MGVMVSLEESNDAHLENTTKGSRGSNMLILLPTTLPLDSTPHYSTSTTGTL